MITRIVKMQFRPDAEQQFLNVFRSAEPHIRYFPGCSALALFKAINEPATYFTVSEWASERALDQYRHSPLFTTTWAATKALFSGPPVAWTLEKQ